MDIKGFFADARVSGRAPKIEAPEDGSLAEAEVEGRKLKASESRKAKLLINRPVVQQIGAGPEADTRPKCRLCGDHRRLTPALCKLPDGGEGRLCPTCVKQVEWDRERRCVSCGTHVQDWLPGGVCGDCHAAGTERLHNVEDLRRKGWIMTPGDTFVP